MSHPVNDDRLVHYLAGECSAEEQERIEAWMDADPDHRAHVEAMRRIWQAAADAPAGARDVDRMWNKLHARIAAPSEDSAPRRRVRPPLQRAGRRSGWRQLARTGAVAVLVVVVALFAAERVVEPEGAGADEAAMREVATETGQRARVTLHDGTRVMLNAESRLTLPDQFAEGERVVHLQGEAYFEVVPDKDRPFRIRANGVVTEVLGTKFNVGAYPDEPDVSVVVDEGTVAVRREGEPRDHEVRLEHDQLAQVPRGPERIVRREVVVEDYVAWMDGRLVFRDAPIQEVARKLRRWFGLQVVLVPSLEEGGVDRLNASFKDESIEDVLNIIAETLNLRYERDGQRVTFLPAVRS